jgi:hypothetical protein
MKELFSDLQNYWDRKRQDSIYVSIARGIILLAGGLLIAHGLRIQNYLVLILGLISIVFYIKLEYDKLKLEKDFPVKILDHLNAKSDLVEVKKDLIRKNRIDKYISKSIIALNGSTCPILFAPNDEICRQNLDKGLKEILRDLIQHLNYLLDIDESDYTFGVFINGYFKTIDTYIENTKLEEFGSFVVLRDDLGLEDQMPKDLTDITKSLDNTLTLHQTFIQTINHSKFVTECIDLDQIGHRIISAPVPSCTKTCDGIIFIIHQNQDEPIKDIENVLDIFGGIVSNWIAKYNSCVWDDFNRKKSKFLNQEIPEFCINEDDIVRCNVCFEDLRIEASEKILKYIESQN